MRSLTSNKLLILILVLAVFLIGLLAYLYLQSSQRRNDSVQFQVTSSNKSISVSSNNKFNYKNLSPMTLNFFDFNQIGLVKINFTETPTPMLTSAFDSQNNPIPYTGFDVKQDVKTLNVTIYISADTLKKLNKTDKDLEFDTIEQMFLSFSYFNEMVKSGNQLTLEQSNQTLSQRYKDAVDQTHRLIDGNNLPFVIHRLGN